jgi:hypothetical protein
MEKLQIVALDPKGPEYLPPEEVKVAIGRVVAENFGAEQDRLVQAVARLFGLVPPARNYARSWKLRLLAFSIPVNYDWKVA